MWHRIDLEFPEIDGDSCIPVVVSGQISINSNEKYGFSSEEYSYDYTTRSSIIFFYLFIGHIKSTIVNSETVKTYSSSECSWL